jgi:integrase-like protein
MSGGGRLLEQVREVIRIKHYSIRTEHAYLQWIRRYILFHGKRHPSELGAEQLSAFLSDLAVRAHVAASTQNQALHAILFLYREVLKQKLPWIEGVQRAKQPQHLPVVLTRTEIKQVLAPTRRDGLADGRPHLRWRPEAVGVLAPARQGHRLRACRVDCPRWQRTEGSRDHAAADVDRATAYTSEPRAATARAGPRRRLRACLSAVRTRSQVSERRSRMGMAICLPAARRSIDPRAHLERSIMPAQKCFSEQSRTQYAALASPSPPACTRSGTPSQHTFFNPAMTSGPCKSCVAAAHAPQKRRSTASDQFRGRA